MGSRANSERGAAAPRSILRSPFARRLVALFFVSALAPTLLLALISFDRVEGLLFDLLERQVRREVKFAAQQLMGNLSLAREMLALDQGSVGSGAGGERRRDLVRVLPSQAGGAGLEHVQASDLRAGGAVLRVVRDDAGTMRLLMSVLPERASGNGVPVRGELVPERIWDLRVDRSLAACVLTVAGEALRCDPRFTPRLRHRIAEQARMSTSGGLRWTADGEPLRAHYWSLFLEADYAQPPWLIALAADESAALAPLARFRLLFPAAVALALLIVALLSLIQIRRFVGPLGSLIEGTRRVAAGDFSAAVDVHGDDEFGELATSFNRMSRRIAHQFRTMETLAAIDRMVLSSTDPEHIVDILIERIPDVVDCAAVAIGSCKEDGALHVCMSVAGRVKQSRTCVDGVAVVASLAQSEEPVRLRLQERDHAELRELLRTREPTHWIVLPVHVSGEPRALIALGFASLPELDASDVGRVCQLSDRAAVALSNAAYEQKLYHQAHYDLLTDLPNRALLHDRLEQAISRAGRGEAAVALLFLDLDHFKRVNDSLGHSAGDTLLVHVAERVSRAVREVDTVVRFGGDEFVVVLPDMPRDDLVLSRASRIAESILAALQPPIVVDGQALAIRASIGIAVYPGDADDMVGLLQSADTALYQAKSEGRGGYHFYSRELDKASQDRIELIHDLAAALDADQLSLDFQPAMRLPQRDFVRAECLLRWKHPRQGLIPPATILSTAVDAGLAEELSRWIVRTACAQLAFWARRGLAPPRLSINLSRREFHGRDLVATVREAIADSGLEPSSLELEITEQVLTREVGRTLKTLHALRTLGVGVVLDDFGTGYSSIAQLAQYPINGLKVDRTFVAAASGRRDARGVVLAARGIARALDLRLSVEGVETREQLDLLSGLGVDEVQGHFICTPMDASRMASWLREKTDREAGRGRVTVTA